MNIGLKEKKVIYLLVLIVSSICFLIGSLRLSAYCLGEEREAKIKYSEFNQGVNQIIIEYKGKIKKIKGYYGDSKDKESYPIHDYKGIVTTKIDIPTSFMLMIFGFIGISYISFKLLFYHLLSNEKEIIRKGS